RAASRSSPSTEVAVSANGTAHQTAAAPALRPRSGRWGASAIAPPRAASATPAVTTGFVKGCAAMRGLIRGRGSRRATCARAPALERCLRLVPLPERAEGVPEGALRRLLVERLVDVGHEERLGGRGPALHLARPRLEGRRHREVQAIQRLERRLAHG